MIWSLRQRVAATADGCFLAFAAVLFCLTDVGQGAQLERARLLAVVISLLLAGLGVYLAAAGVWGAWSPGGDERLRVRSIRLTLSWAALASLALCRRLPLTNHADMTRTEWMLFSVLAGFLTIAVFAIVAVRRTPRVTIVFLGIGSAYAGANLLYFVRLVLMRSSMPSGPGAATAFVLAGSIDFTIGAAFLLSWPLWTDGDHAASRIRKPDVASPGT